MSSILRVSMFSVSVFLLLAVLAPSNNAHAGTFVAFDPTDYSRSVGKPIVETDLFSVYNPDTDYTIHIYNGGKAGQYKKVRSSAVIKVNDIVIIGPKDFSHNVDYIERPVVLEKDNELSIEMRGSPGSGLTVEITGLDNEPPTISAIITPPPNADGWHNSDVTVEFECSDVISGVAFCPQPVLVQTEGTDQVVSSTAIDNAGNETSTSVIIKLDKTPPQIAATPPPPNENGWYNADVTVDFDCSDDLSGIASCPDPVLVQTEGVGYEISGTAIDYAGNESFASTIINLDKTPPQMFPAWEPPPNANGWNNTNVTANFVCDDNLSGMASCPEPVWVQTEGTTSIQGLAIDSAGNETSMTASVMLDKTPPVITPIVRPPDLNNWYNKNVTVDFDCSDNLSGVASSPLPVTVQTEGYGQLVPAMAIDSAGNESSTATAINLDKTPPQVLITSPSPNDTLKAWEKTPVEVTGSLYDNLSGIDMVTINGDIFYGWDSGPFSTDIYLEEGPNTIAITVFDFAGHSATSSVNVAYEPITMEDIARKFAPQLRFDEGDDKPHPLLPLGPVGPGGDQFPMSAQKYYERQVIHPDPLDNYGNDNSSTVTDNLCPTYWHAITCGKQIRIFYWWFYGRQYQMGPLGVYSTGHPGDWEQIMVTLSEDTTEVGAVTFYQHGPHHFTRYKRQMGVILSDDTGKEESTGPWTDYTHPVVWVGRVAHGSYSDYYNGWQGFAHWDDRRDGEGPWMDCWQSPLIDLDLGEEGWMTHSDTNAFSWGRGGVTTQPYRDRDKLSCSIPSCYDAGCIQWDYHQCKEGNGWITTELLCSTLPCGGPPYYQYANNYDIPQTDIGILTKFCPSGAGAPTDMESNENEIPEEAGIAQNYPNPFNPTTTFSYSIPKGSHVTIEIINILGQTVRTLVDESKSAGVHQVEWDGDDFDGSHISSGVYFYRFQAGDVVETKKMILLK